MSDDNGTRVPLDPKAAREQAAEYLGFTASKLVAVPNGGPPVEIPNPGLLSDDQQERYNELQLLLETCDREPDEVVPAHTITSAGGTETIIPEQTVKGARMTPLRIKGKLLNYNTRLAQAILGEAEYARFKAGGGEAIDIGLQWRVMEEEAKRRQAQDPKSVPGAVRVAPVPDADRG